MKRYTWIIAVIPVLLIWAGMGPGNAQALGVIYPVNATAPPYPPDPSLGVTVSLRTMDGVDVTTTWLPVPGVSVEIVVNGIADYNISLVPPGPADPIENEVLMTSAYPGVCTNYGSDTEPDFTLNGSVLTAYDSGGMAVVKVVSVNGDEWVFVIPQDDNFNGIASNWERLYCASGVSCLNRNEDIDTGPEADSAVGDFIANRDEYRGFRVNGQIVRGDPNVKDVFVHFVETPQCVSEATLTDDVGNLIELATFYDTDFTPMFANMNTLVPGMRCHYINSGEWEDYFLSYDTTNDVTLSGSSPENAIRDRQINKNALHPLGREHLVDPTTTIKITKGIRLVQCLKTAGTTMGLMVKRPPDGFEKDDGTAVIFPQRIWQSYKNKILVGAGRALKHFAFEGRKWVEKNLWENPPMDPNAPFSVFIEHPGVLSIVRDCAIPFYAAHEALGHGTDLTLTIESTRKEVYGYHHAEGTGTNIDIRVVHQVDDKTAGYNKFYIPKTFGTSDKIDMRLSETQ